jgi:hypothetical protein
MAYRIRYAMTPEPSSSKVDGVVEIDEAYIWRQAPCEESSR